MTLAETGSETAVAYPPRYWWLRRIALGFALLILLLGLVRLWWGYDAKARLDAAIAEIRAGGEPILPDDFVFPAVPDRENAAYYLKQAAAALNSAAEPPAETNMEYSYAPLPAEWFEVARKAVEGNQPSLKLLREARRHTKVDWGLKFKTPVFNAMMPGLNSQRHLANLLGDTAVYEHFTGNDAAALEHIRDIFAAADALDQQPILVSHLVAGGVRALALHRLQVIAPGIRLADDPSPATAPSTRPAVPAQRAQVQALIALLLDLRSQQEGMRRALQGERMMQVDSIDWMTNNSLLLRPMYQLDQVRVLEPMRQFISSTTQPTWPAAQQAMTAPAPLKPSLARLMSSVLSPSLQRAIEIDYRIHTERAMTAVSLAARLYQIDHHGQWPANLEALVPLYLPSVSLDPFSPAGKPLGYLLAKNGTRPIVYSMGTSGTDRAMSESELRELVEPSYGWQGKTKLQWRDLSYFEPSPAATKPADE